jgi:hypothetical protein
MFFPHLCVDQDVVYIDYDDFIEYVFQDMIYHIMKGSRSVGEADRHHHQLMKTVPAIKGSFSFILFFYTDQMVAIVPVHFRQPLHTSDAVL